MEITLLEDPACLWCWAFQPVVTALEFEFLRKHAGPLFKLRRVMGGLQDRPFGEPALSVQHWQTAEKLSGMPFNPAIWDRHILRTSFEACRAVKAAQPQGQAAADRYLRRIREAFFVEGRAVDERDTLVALAAEEGLDVDSLREQLSNGRAEFLFERDRREAAPYRFGFPILVIHKHPNEPPVILNGVVPYGEVLGALETAGLRLAGRARFADNPEAWEQLFAIHPRLALAEVRLVTRLEGDALAGSLERNGVENGGPFLRRARGRTSRPRSLVG